MRKKLIGIKHFSLQEHAQKVPNLLFSNSNSSIDVCLQIPFCIRLQLKIIIFVPFEGKKRHFAPPFLAMQGDLSFLGNLFPMASILLFNPAEKSSCHFHCFVVETRQLKHKTAN